MTGLSVSSNTSSCVEKDVKTLSKENCCRTCRAPLPLMTVTVLSPVEAVTTGSVPCFFSMVDDICGEEEERNMRGGWGEMWAYCERLSQVVAYVGYVQSHSTAQRSISRGTKYPTLLQHLHVPLSLIGRRRTATWTDDDAMAANVQREKRDEGDGAGVDTSRNSPLSFNDQLTGRMRVGVTKRRQNSQTERKEKREPKRCRNCKPKVKSVGPFVLANHQSASARGNSRRREKLLWYMYDGRGLRPS